LLLGEGHELTRQLRQLAEDEGPVILQL